MLPEYLIKAMVTAVGKVHNSIDAKTARKAIQTYTAAQREQALREMKVSLFSNLLCSYFLKNVLIF